MIENANHYADIYGAIQSLGQDMVDASLEVQKSIVIKNKERDVRVTAFTTLANVCVSTSLGFGLYGKHLLREEFWQEELITPMPPEVITGIQKEFEQFLRLGFVHFNYMALESAIRSLNKAIAPHFSDHNFTCIYENLLRETGFSRYKCLLKLLRLLRNTLHTNGYHNKPDDSVTYHGKVYHFKNGTMPPYFDWLCLVERFQDARAMMLDIVKTNKIESLEYAEDVYLASTDKIGPL